MPKVLGYLDLTKDVKDLKENMIIDCTKDLDPTAKYLVRREAVFTIEKMYIESIWEALMKFDDKLNLKKGDMFRKYISDQLKSVFETMESYKEIFGHIKEQEADIFTEYKRLTAEVILLRGDIEKMNKRLDALGL